MLKFINTIFGIIFIAALLGVAGLLVGSMLPIPGNIEIKIVKSGSMEPAIPTGSLVVVKPSASFSYNVGDVITFGPDTQSEIPTTHRIVSVGGLGSERVFITKGDANEDVDQESVALSEVIGKVLIHVPGAGFVLDFARQPLGFALLIALPAGLIILEEVITIAKEARAALRRRRGEDDPPKGGTGLLDEDGAPLRLFYGRVRAMDEIFVPMYMKPGWMHPEWWHKQFRFHKDTYGTSTALVLGLVFMSSMMAGGAGGTISYFNDIERSIGNVFRAGQWADQTPAQGDPQNIVLNEFLPNPDGVAFGFDFGNDASNMPQGEWIELYNMGTTSVDVAGWYMTDASGGLGNTHAVIDGTNTLPAGTVIAPGEWLVVYLNKPSLNDTGDSIFLYTSTSTGSVLVDSYTYENPSDFCTLEPTPTDPNSTSTPTGTPGNGPNADCPQAQVAPNKSYARIPDGTGAWVDPIPTPGSWNIPDPEPTPEPESQAAVHPEAVTEQEKTLEPEETPVPEGGGGGGSGGGGGAGEEPLAPEETGGLLDEPGEPAPEELETITEGAQEPVDESQEETPAPEEQMVETVEEPAPMVEEPAPTPEPPAEASPEVI